jgi:hypothetical protein
MARQTGAEQASSGVSGVGYSTVRNFFPSYRVFVAGFEVTAICSAVRINWADRNPQQVQIELNNPDQLMTITEADMLTISAYRQGLTTQFPTQAGLTAASQQVGQIYEAAGQTLDPSTQGLATPPDQVNIGVEVDGSAPVTPENLTQAIIAAATGQVFFQPYGVTALPPFTLDILNLKNYVIPPKLQVLYRQNTMGVDGALLPLETFFKYPFVQGQWIWHHNDPVRVAFRDPVDPTTWYWMHAGTVTDINEKENEDSQSSLTLTSECVLKDLRNSRLANTTASFLSPSQLSSVTGQQVAVSPEQLSAFTDAEYTDLLTNLTLAQILELMIFGSQALLDNLGQLVYSSTPPSVIAEVLGVTPVQAQEQGESLTQLTDQTITSLQQQLRANVVAGLADFKKWKATQGVQIMILTGSTGLAIGTSSPVGSSNPNPALTPADQAIGVALANGLPDWQGLLDHRVTIDDLTDFYIVDKVSMGSTSDTAGRPPGANRFSQQPSIRNTQTQNAQQMVNDYIQSASDPNLATSAQAQHANLIDTIITTIGSNPDDYPIRQRVYCLLPANLGARLGRQILDLEMAGNPSSTAEYYDRLSLLVNVMNRIEFSLYGTGRGDIVVEMPLYDFEPRHFASAGELNNPFTEPNNPPQNDSSTYGSNLQEGFDELANIQGAEDEINFIGLEATNYDLNYRIFPWEQCGCDITATDQDIKTVWVAKGRLVAQNKSGSNDKKRVAVALPNLVPLYGFRVEQGDPQGYLRSDDAVRLFCFAQLNKTNADIVSLHVPCTPNWTAWLNRPVQVDRRSIIGATKSINHSIVWQSDISTEYGFWHCKFWDGRIVNDTVTGKPRKLYATFGGVNAQPFNYAYLLKRDSINQALGTSVGSSQADSNAQTPGTNP